MTLTLELDGLTAATLEIARVARAVSLTKERILNAEAEIAATKLRLMTHLKHFRADQRRRKRRLLKQQNELRRQIKRHKAMGR